jgi:hypothetical protein
MFQEAIEHVAAWRAGGITDHDMRSFLRERDRASRLEMDSASFNHFYLQLLVEEFPDAKFVFTVRDCVSWVESFLQMMLRNRKRHFELGRTIPAWQVSLGQLMVGQFDPDLFVSRDTLLEALPQIVDGYLRFWAEANLQVLSILPRERSLTVPTLALTQSLPQICGFLGAAEDNLVLEAAHRNRGDAAAPLLATLDRDLLRARAQSHCGPLMARLFPDEPLVAAS